MGLISSAVGSVAGALGDQWRDYFFCDALSSDVLVKKARKKNGSKSGSDVISNGSIIAVNEGQCMMIVDQGSVVEFTAEAGEFIFDSSTEPSIFYGELDKNIKSTWESIKRRFTFGGDVAKDMRVYYFNLKDITGNKYGTAQPVPFRVVDKNIGLDVDIAVRCFGEFSYRITDPMLFYKNVCGNVPDTYMREELASQLRSELLTALQPSFAKLSDMGIRYSSLPAHTQDLAQVLNEYLSERWGGHYGIRIQEIGMNSIKASEEDEKMIKDLQKNAVFKDPTMAAAHLVGAQASAMQSAASNTSAGPMMAFAGMNMAAQSTGFSAQELYQVSQKNGAGSQSDGWVCPSCHTAGNKGKFCAECGSPRPAPAGVWICSCGAENTGKFCSECGKPKPADNAAKTCRKCGFVFENPQSLPKFCPECGEPT